MDDSEVEQLHQAYKYVSKPVYIYRPAVALHLRQSGVYAGSTDALALHIAHARHDPDRPSRRAGTFLRNVIW